MLHMHVSITVTVHSYAAGVMPPCGDGNNALGQFNMHAWLLCPVPLGAALQRKGHHAVDIMSDLNLDATGSCTNQAQEAATPSLG